MEEKSKSELLGKAMAFAAERHGKQTRKDGSPYFYHPMEIAAAVRKTGYPTEYQITAVLHDVYEDTCTTYEELCAFGKDVADAVMLLSKNYEPTDEAGYINRILKNRMAAVVKNCDRIFNLREAAELGDRAFLEKYVKESKDYFERKFSRALDEAIAAAQKALKTGQRPTRNDYDGFELYSDISG